MQQKQQNESVWDFIVNMKIYNATERKRTIVTDERGAGGKHKKKREP